MIFDSINRTINLIKMKLLKLFLICLCIISCAPVYVNYDYEKGTNFVAYKTYGFYDDMETGLSELDTKRFILAINNKLNTLGLTQSQNPDFLIDLKSMEYTEQSRNTVGVGLGGGGNVGGGLSIGIPVGNSKITREITIDFVDESKNGLFWQAKSESTYNPNSKPEKREANLLAIVEKVFKTYPPKIK